MYIYMCTSTYLSLSLCISIIYNTLYMYIYTCTYVYTYIIYTHRARYNTTMYNASTIHYKAGVQYLTDQLFRNVGKTL